MGSEQPGGDGRIWSVPYVILIGANFFQSMASFMANTTLPLYVDRLGAAAGTIGIVVGAFAVTALLIRPFAGPAFDSFSRKRMLIAAQAVIAAAFVLYGAIESVPGLVAVRLLHGLGIGCAGPLSLALVSEYLPPTKLASGVSIYMLAQSLAQVIGPATGLYLIDAIGFGGTYRISAVLLAASALSISCVREIERERPPYEFRLDRMFAREAVQPALVLMLFAMAFAGVTGYLVLYCTKLEIPNIGAYYSVYALCLLATRPLFGKLADAFGAERVLIPGLLCFAASYVLLANITTFAGLMVVAVVAASGFGTCVPLVQSLAMARVPAEHRGAASNTSFTGLDLGMLLGPVTAGAAIEILHGITGDLLAAYSAMWFVMLVPMAIALVIVAKWNLAAKKS